MCSVRIMLYKPCSTTPTTENAQGFLECCVNPLNSRKLLTLFVCKRKHVHSAGAVDWGHRLKYVSLAVLVVQNASQVLLIRHARTRPKCILYTLSCHKTLSLIDRTCSSARRLCSCRRYGSYSPASSLSLSRRGVLSSEH